MRDLAEVFSELEVDLNVVCLPWVLSLLSCVVPLDHLHLVYEGFIRERWQFVYRVVLSIFLYHKPTLMRLQDHGDVLALLSATNDKRTSYDWEDIILFANSLTL